MMRERAQQIGHAAAAANARLRNQRFHWCRLWDGFVDMPLWRVVAADAGAALAQVQAFVVRLDSFANAQLPRGDVAYFDPVEFAVALDIPAELAARIFAALEARDWVEQDHVTSFWWRNRDSDKDTAATTPAERKRRERAFKAALRELVKQEKCGFITAAELTARHIELDALRRAGKTGAMTWPEQAEVLSALLKVIHSAGMSRSAAAAPASHPANAPAPSAGRGAGFQDVTASRDHRDSHTRADQSFRPAAPVDNFGDKASGESGGPSEDGASGTALNPQEATELWLASDGVRIVTEQLLENRGKAELLVARWRDQELGGDAAALADIIRGAEKTGLFGATFLNLIVTGVRDAKRRATTQGELRLPVLASERKMG